MNENEKKKTKRRNGTHIPASSLTHGKQEACCAWSWYIPARQSLHSVGVSIDVRKLPAAQVLQPPPTTSPYSPAPHTVHFALPLVEVQPWGQLTQMVASMVLPRYWLVKQILQEDEAPSSLAYVPGIHGKQEACCSSFWQKPGEHCFWSKRKKGRKEEGGERHDE